LFLFDQFGDLERVLLRRGNCSSAKYGRGVLLPVIERYRGLDIPKFFRGDRPSAARNCCASWRGRASAMPHAAGPVFSGKLLAIAYVRW
jgi:hypothetical protein